MKRAHCAHLEGFDYREFYAYIGLHLSEIYSALARGVVQLCEATSSLGVTPIEHSARYARDSSTRDNGDLAIL